MGLFDFVLPFGSEEKQIQRHGKRVRNMNSSLEDREASARWLADNGSPEAIYQMLRRYDQTYEHQMKDLGEKELIDALAMSLGERALEPLRAYCLKNKSFARPLKVYERLTSPDLAKALTLEMLAMEAERSELKPAKKREVLIKLADYRDPEIPGVVLEHLAAFDEGVRYAAAEVLIAQHETDTIRAALLEALANGDEDSNRLRVRLAEIATTRRWALGEHAAALSEAPPPGFVVRGEVLVKG